MSGYRSLMQSSDLTRRLAERSLIAQKQSSRRAAGTFYVDGKPIGEAVLTFNLVGRDD
ncbi:MULTISPECIES: hypothetical protein [unclassified Sporosarcina]|uniref:hypothetical protein n=1 Tax=unclassified Sporosarcina TaxID=2647733 RepID=UPI0012F4827E|nr:MULTISPECIES: hypothetical protein [unclassified Sporosarcina]